MTAKATIMDGVVGVTMAAWGAVGMLYGATDAQSMVMTVGGISMLFGLWYKVWSNNSISNRAMKDLRDDRDFWRAMALKDDEEDS